LRSGCDHLRMNCSISGQPAVEPVVSKHGDIFEKRLIVKHIEANGTCPITNEAMTLEDLIPIRLANANAVKPRQLSATSVPALLQTFQNEWDALMLETYHLKKQLETTRQELSHALYQSDAACRVIARTIKERDAARRELEQLRIAVGRGGVTKMEVESQLPGLDSETRTKMTTKSVELSAMRKQKEPAPETATIEQIKGYKQVWSQTPHKVSSPGLVCVDLHPANDDIIATGGVDRTVLIINRRTAKKEATLVGHNKKVNSVLFHPTKDVVLTASADHTVKIWTQNQDQYKALHTINLHAAEVVGLSLHATHDYVVSASLDHTWAFHNIETGKSLLQIAEPSNSPLTCVMLHPDGLILATGTEDNGIRIWDLKTQKNVATFQGHKGGISAVRFSENGYYLASAAKDNQLKLWDLRGPKNVHSVRVDSEVASLDYDYSGKYLAAATGSEVRVFSGKTLDHVQTFGDHSNVVTAVKWGTNAQVLASVSMDRTLKLWGSQ